MIRKNILVLIDEHNYTEENQSFFRKTFDNQNFNFLYYKNEFQKFYLDDRVVDIDSFLVITDFVYNFLSDEKSFETIQKKIELMKLNYFGNSFSDVKIFSEKINFKRIIDKSNFKTPVFEKINKQNPLELFNNFVQPSRIFSKTNNYYSDKINSLEKVSEIFQDKKEEIENYYVEEFIPGDNLFIFAFKNSQGNFNLLSILENNNEIKKLNNNFSSKINSDLNNFLKKYNFKDFILLNLVYSEKRGLYFLNIWLKNMILLEKKDLVEKILDEYDYNLSKILQKDLI